MPTFTYKALDSAGKEALGEIEAKTRGEAFKKLQEQRLRPVRIEAGEGGKAAGGEKPGEPAKPTKLRLNQQLQLAEELAELLEAGLQLEPALRVIETREETSSLKPVAAWLRQQIREGRSLSGSMRDSGAGFSELFINMVAAGEASGALGGILRKQAEYTAVVIELRKRMVTAMIYPCIVFGAGILLLSAFMLFLLPQLTSLLSKTGQELPLVTRLLIDSSAFFGRFWWAILLVIGIAIVAHRMWVATPAGRDSWDRIKLRLPLVGPVLKMSFLAQFLQTLSTLVGNGVVLLSALQLVRNATGNTYIRKLLDTIVLQVGEGAALSRALKKHEFFPSVLIDIVGVGEQTGKIAPALQRGAMKYDKEFSSQIQRLTILIQPITIMAVAIFVGVVAYSMITGILSTVNSIRMR